jgi:integrase
LIPKHFVRLVTRARLRHIRLHYMRHTNARLLLRNNVNSKIVSERLVHANISITLDQYSTCLRQCRRKQPSAVSLRSKAHSQG